MLFEVLVAQLKANIFLPDLENESESEFPKLQAGAFQTLAKKASSCVLQLFCLVKIITITLCFQKESGPPPVAGV